MEDSSKCLWKVPEKKWIHVYSHNVKKAFTREIRLFIHNTEFQIVRQRLCLWKCSHDCE